MISVVILLLSIAWIVLTTIYIDKSTQEEITAPKQGFLAPNFSLESVTGDVYNLSNLTGKVVMINFWTSWCPPCRAEMPAMQRVFQDYKDQSFMILAVNATNQDTLEDASEFISHNRLTFPILLDIDGLVIDLYQVQSFPSSFFIDQNGIVREIVIGGPMSQALMETRILKMFNEEY
jgi:peroxiredoxin